MNLRDEIAKAAAQFDQSVEGKWHGHQMADALMPIVERVAREVLHDAITAATFDGPMAAILAVVRAHDRDGERYRFITEDHADSSVRAKIREISNRLPVMSYAAASAAIDAARGES